ncbi:MAG: flagellar biosynthesis protein FlhB, partial [Candidatus Methylomirabilales bacterium]
VGFVLVKVLRESLPQLAALQSSDVATALGLAGSIAWRMAQQSAIALVAIGAIDYGFQRRQHEAQLRMTKQEVREELKQTEGDPAIRSRLRQRQREMARGRMMRDVPGATAVVTNPTQIAVALKYEAGVMAAPKVVAKGQRLMAQRIRQVAEEHGVPIVENKPLARSLFRDVEIGDGVPPELYRAVAEVLAFVYRLSERKPGSSAGSPRAEL